MVCSVRIRTIIIEDNASYREEIILQIEKSTIVEVVASFPSLEDGLDFLDNEPDIDFFLVDIGLPGIDGVTGIPQLLEKSPNAKVAMHTVFDEKELVFEAIKQGACGYLLKGESEGRLEKAIEEIMSGGSFFSPTIAQQVLSFFRKRPLSKIKITKREKEILNLIAEGLAKKQIANKLFITYHTVDSHVKNIYQKLHVKCGVQAVIKAQQEGLI